MVFQSHRYCQQLDVTRVFVVYYFISGHKSPLNRFVCIGVNIHTCVPNQMCGWQNNYPT